MLDMATKKPETKELTEQEVAEKMQAIQKQKADSYDAEYQQLCKKYSMQRVPEIILRGGVAPTVRTIIAPLEQG